VQKLTTEYNIAMEPIYKSEIFFFISSVSVIIITTIILIAGIYFIKTVRNLSKITGKIKKAVDSVDYDITEIGERVKDSQIFNFVFGKKKTRKQKEK